MSTEKRNWKRHLTKALTILLIIHGLPFHPTVVYHQSTFRFWHGNVKRRYG